MRQGAAAQPREDTQLVQPRETGSTITAASTDRLTANRHGTARRRIGAVVLCWLAAVATSPAVVASAAARDNALDVSFASDASVRLQGRHFVARTRSDAAALNDAVARGGAVRIQRLVEESPASPHAVRRPL